MDKTNFSIGFFDSGVGGISVLKEAVKLLPKENYIYIGDSLNAPYGVKTPEEVRKLTFNMVDKLISMNVKAIVVACNTATSIAIDELRRIYKEIPIIGIEPALKPAVENYGNGIITKEQVEKFEKMVCIYIRSQEAIPPMGGSPAAPRVFSKVVLSPDAACAWGSRR